MKHNKRIRIRVRVSSGSPRHTKKHDSSDHLSTDNASYLWQGSQQNLGHK